MEATGMDNITEGEDLFSLKDMTSGIASEDMHLGDQESHDMMGDFKYEDEYSLGLMNNPMIMLISSIMAESGQNGPLPSSMTDIHALATANLISQTQEAIIQEYNIDMTSPDYFMSDFSQLDSVMPTETTLSCGDPENGDTSNTHQQNGDGLTLLGSSRNHIHLDPDESICAEDEENGDKRKTHRGNEDGFTLLESVKNHTKLNGNDENHITVHFNNGVTNGEGHCKMGPGDVTECKTETLKDTNSTQKTLYQGKEVSHHVFKDQRVSNKNHFQTETISTQSVSKLDCINDHNKQFTGIIRDAQMMPTTTVKAVDLKRLKDIQGHSRVTDSVNKPCTGEEIQIDGHITSTATPETNKKMQDKEHKEIVLCKTKVKGLQVFGESGEQIVCELCGKTLRNKKALENHQTSHAPLCCPIPGCERTFNYPSHYKYHLLTHSEVKKFSCVECGKVFYTNQQLLVHQRTHNLDKPFTCNQCDKAFTTAGNLKNHQRLHTGEKPFTCTVNNCYKSFAETSSLKKHILTHSGEKPYKCTICNKGFTQSSSRIYHMKHKHSNQSEDLNTVTSSVTSQMTSSVAYEINVT